MTTPYIRPHRLARRISLLALLILLLPSLAPVYASASTHERSADYWAKNSPPDGPVIARVYYPNDAALNHLNNDLDVWEVHTENNYVIALISPMQYKELIEDGFRIYVDDDKTAQLTQPRQLLAGQTSGIPGFPCYRTVQETQTALVSLAAVHPGLAAWVDIGDSWEKVTPTGALGYDLQAIKLTNTAIPGPKPVFFLMGAIHGREYTTGEVATRFAEYLVGQYGSDADVTWMLDHYEVHIVPIANPDGRRLAEGGALWRKNTNSTDGCSDPNAWGVDMNRNFNWNWRRWYDEVLPCTDDFPGSSGASEPETRALQSYITSIFPDQREQDLKAPAPADASGVLVTLHSYMKTLIWPWTDDQYPAPNGTQLATLGRKLAYFNGYIPLQGNGKEWPIPGWVVSGTIDNWAYGTLGMAAFTFEMGDNEETGKEDEGFFESCSDFEARIWPDNLQSLLYALKATRRPYQHPAGPDSLSVAVAPDRVKPGEAVILVATADDTRYEPSQGDHGEPILEPTQTVASARYTIDTPPWSPNAAFGVLVAQDGAFDEGSEDLASAIDTTGLTLGRHILYVESIDAKGNIGAPSAAFFWVDGIVSVEPSLISAQLPAGRSAVFSLTVTNVSSILETYRVELQGNNWPAFAPASLGPLAPGASTRLEITVTVPAGLPIGTADTLKAAVIPQSDPTKVAAAVFSSQVGHPTFLPMIQ